MGVLTGADVERLSRPFPAGIESGTPQWAAAGDTARYVGEPIAVVVARDRYLAEDAAELVEVDYDPLDPVLDPMAATAVHDRSFSYGEVDGGMAEADLVVRQTFHVPRFTCTPVECFVVVADWDEAAGRLTAWANFQGPFTLHGVAAAALGLKGDRLRLLTPPDSGGSFGIKAAVFSYVVLIGLAARHFGVPVTWTEDRLEHLAASAAATGRTTEVEAGFASDGRLLALRYDAVEDVGAYVRAPEPATLYRMHGSLTGAYRVANVAVRNRVVLTNTIPSGLNRGFGGPQLYFGLERTMAIAARRLGLDPAELARRNLIPGGGDAVPHALRGAVRLRRLRRLSRRGTRARGLRPPAHRRRGGARGGAPDGDRSRLHRRALDLEHGLHHPGADRRRARPDAAEVRQRRGRIGDDRPARGHHRQDRHHTPGPGTPDGLRPGGRRCARLHTGRRHRALRDGYGRRTLDGRLRQLLVAVLGCRRRRRPGSSAEAEGQGRRDPRPRRRRRPLVAPRRGDGALEPRGSPRGPGTRPRRGRLLGTAHARPSDCRRPGRVVRRPRRHRRHLRRRGRSRDRQGGHPRLRHRARRGPPPQPASGRRPGSRRLRARRRRSALRTTRVRRVGQPDDGLARRLPRADRAGHPPAPDRPPLLTVTRSPRSGPRGSARATP